ncbi:HAD-IC family P-type ATPase [Ramlibacter tataouinensis]|uniref:cation-translocating P-type ATPase n=1 Tax=Ramlibacter tataouinensis TaxID=94132 RepID=UPI0022F3B4CD|nr:HAD-IC family P-type ATPase [Ramlibacter tataouinensis]WBY01663.1 HAD-IC family P-type ATPase [Ramlibacter tataouinensis]
MAQPSNASGPAGLTTAQARARLLRQGPNEVEAPRRRLAWLAEVGTEPMFLLLLAAAGLYLLIGEPADGLLLAFFACMTVGLVLWQRRRSDRALASLRSLAAPLARVLRDGQVSRVPAVELVPGDWILLAEGDRIPADAELVDSVGLAVDESLLTGEALPVGKRAAREPAAEPGVPGGDDTPFVFAGTLAVAGHGTARVLATGRATQIGRIGRSLAGIDRAATPLQRHLRRVVRVLALAALAASASIALWSGLRGGGWLQGALQAITVAMALLPDELPMILTVFLALGAWRLARQQVLARSLGMVEALGAIRVLCVDKTGTLTENRMRLRRLVTPTADVDVLREGPLPEEVHELLEYAMLASRRAAVDPIDAAILARGDAAPAFGDHLHPDWRLLQEYPVTPELLAMSQAWVGAGGHPEVAAKGAPEAVADLCHLDAPAAAALLDRAAALAGAGLRVLAVARGSAGAGTPAPCQHDYAFTPLGLVAFEDPLRAGAAVAVAQARAAGVAVAMITGDHAATALAIARQAGIETAAGVLTGEQIDALDETQLGQAVARVRVFARVLPQHKLRLVRAFQAGANCVAMTGDGVNDAPALKAADVGIAMGRRGADVAREAAGLVLMEEDMGAIVRGIGLGRRIFDNMRRASIYVTAIHVPIAGLALLPVLLGLPAVLLPAHVVLAHLVIEPACSFAFEGAPPATDTLTRPPRDGSEMLLGWAAIGQGAVQGAWLLLGVALAWLLGWRLEAGADQARSVVVIALTAGNLMLVWVAAGQPGALSSRPSGAVLAVAALVVAVLALALSLPPLGRLLHVTMPSVPGVLIALVAAGLGVAAGATFGRRGRRPARPARPAPGQTLDRPDSGSSP